MNDDLLTSSEVAELFGVTPMTVVRWAESGRLKCEKTAGRHRRFRRADIEALREEHEPSGDVERWVRLLIGPARASAIEAALLAAHARLGDWASVADSLGPVLTEIGRRWQQGEITVFDEHVASEQLMRGLSRVGEWLPRRDGAPRVLLATPPGETHVLGLALVELCFRADGWESIWAGASTPVRDLVLAVERSDIRVLALSASRSTKNAKALGRDLRAIERACEAAGVSLVIGGSGAWPKRPERATRLSTFADLAGRMRSFRAQ